MDASVQRNDKDIRLSAETDKQPIKQIKQVQTQRIVDTKSGLYSKLLSSSDILEGSEENNRLNNRRLEPPSASLSYSERAAYMRSVDQIRLKSQLGDRVQGNLLSDNLSRLKMEETTFKIKTKIGSLLKEVGISMSQLTRFSSLLRVQEMLMFLSQRVRERLMSTERVESDHLKLLSKDRQMLSQYQIQIGGLRRKIQEKEMSQKSLKVKIKETHNELREIYDRINQKEKELSLKVTELYQTKMLVKESQKIIDNLQFKYASLEKERNELRRNFEESHRSTQTYIKEMERENIEMRQREQDFRDELERAKEKEVRIQQSNNQLSEQVARWRERFEEVRGEKQSPLSPRGSQQRLGAGKQRDLSVLELQNSNLLSKIADLQQANRQLQWDLLNYSQVKAKYDFSSKSVQKYSFNDRSTQETVLDDNSKRKLQVLVKEWKDKLYEVVLNYEGEMQTLRLQIDRLQKEKGQLESRVNQLSQEKYQVESRLLEREEQFYQLSKSSGQYAGSLTTPLRERTKEDEQLQEMLLSAKYMEPNQTQNDKDNQQHTKEQIQEAESAVTEVMLLSNIEIPEYPNST